MWSEIKRFVQYKVKSNLVSCDISPDDFNRHFVNVAKNLDKNFKKKPHSFLWKGAKSSYIFKFRHIPDTAIKHYLNSLSNKHGFKVAQIG